MNRVKLIFYDFEAIKTVELLNVISRLWADYIYAKPGLIFVRTNDTPETIYANLGALIEDKNIFISCVDQTPGSYYGYMREDLWRWLLIRPEEESSGN